MSHDPFWSEMRDLWQQQPAHGRLMSADQIRERARRLQTAKVWGFVTFSVSLTLTISPGAVLGDSCDLFPIALPATQLSKAAPGSVIVDLPCGTSPGNFGWITWGGSPSDTTLVDSLKPPGDSTPWNYKAIFKSDTPKALRDTTKARFGDWIETMVYNAIGAALPTEPDGRTYYYGDYRLSSGLKQHYWHEWPCCSGTYWQLMADYHNVIYFKAPGALYVNLFVPSEVTWSHDGQSVRVRQETTYPEADTTTLHVELEGPARFALRLRIPGWARRASVSVNGALQTVPIVAGQWATVDREWRAGDALTLRLPMELRMSPVDAQHPDRVAILFGPTVLAQDEACCRRPFALASTADLSSALVREENDPARFRIVDTAPERHRRFLQPLYTFPAFWPYWVSTSGHAPWPRRS